MKDIKITVADKKATLEGTPIIVCGNSDYTVTFSFDSEWSAMGPRTARFVYIKNGEKQHTDVVFSGATVAVPVLSDVDFVQVGVFEGNLATTTPARILCSPSILCGTGSTSDSLTEDVYNQLLALVVNLAEKGSFGATEEQMQQVEQNAQSIAQLSTEKADRVDLEVLDARMDTFTHLEEGSTTGDAELADIRVAADGKTYESAGAAVRGQVSSLESGLYEQGKMVNGIYTSLVISNNLIDPARISKNHFIGATGVYTPVSGYSVSDYIPLNGKNIIANALRSNTNPAYLVYDANYEFLRSVTMQGSVPYVYQSGDAYIRINFRDSAAQTPQANYGDTLLAYDDYKIGSLKQLSIKNIVHIGAGYDYEEVQTALDAITDDSEANPYILIVHPGEYEYFTMRTNKEGTLQREVRHISIIGFDKNTTIIKDNRGAYAYPAAEIFTNGTIENISFINKATSETYAPAGRQNFAYAMHTDFGTEKVTFKNCYFYSNAGSAVGCGTWNDGVLEFINCTFESECDGTFGETGKGAFFCHTASANDVTNQKLVLDNCLSVSKTENIGGRLAVITGYTGGSYEYLIKNTGFFGINGPNVSITDPDNDLFSAYNFGNVPNELN